jgi:alpha-L-fucosidase
MPPRSRALGLAAAAAAAARAAALPSSAAYAHMDFPGPGLPLFDQAKFGLFVHWGPVSQWGTEISFPLVCTGFPCDTVGPGNAPITLHNESELATHRAAYRALASTFNPVNFDAAALADIAYGAGIRYITYTAEHCDGFSGWNATQNRAYSSVATPFGRDIVGELLPAFRARGMRAGVYVCPSTWNNDLYWWPNATTSFGQCCVPNYDPLDAAMAPVWARYVDYLHTQVTELTEQYAPDHFWFDSGTYPPAVDTHIETLVPAMRAANPNVVLHVRDGGVWHDYVEPNDHSEAVVDAILGLAYASSGDKFEVPGTLGDQWAYDPHAIYKSAPTVLRDLIPIVAKGGNYLLNIGLDSTGVWAPAALTTLANLTSWFAFAGEAVHGTQPAWPYSYAGCYFTQSADASATYVLFWNPGSASREHRATLRRRRGGARGVSLPTGPCFTQGYDAVSGADTLAILLPPYKPSTLRSTPRAVSRLTAAGVEPVSWSLTEAGLAANLTGVAPASDVALTTFFLATNSSAADRAPCALRDCAVYTSDGYVAEAVEGSCLRSAAAPSGEETVPVTLFYNGGWDNMGAAAAPADGQAWGAVDVECFAYVASGAGRVALEVWHSAALGDFWTLASDASRARAVQLGYVRVSGVGYIDAAPTEPAVEAYAYVLRIDF